MATYKLYYFDARGRGEIARLLFAHAGVEYEDVRLGGEKWQAKKKEMPFGQMPVLEVTESGKTTMIPQGKSLCRYLAREFGLEGKNKMDVIRGDFLTEHQGDVVQPILALFSESDADKKAKGIKEALEGPVANRLVLLEKYVESSGFLVGDCITLADINFIVAAEMLLLKSETILDKTPKLKALYEKVRSSPKIAAWIAKRPKTTF